MSTRWIGGISMASKIYMPASWFSNAIHALTQPRRPIAGNGPQTESARSAMARILAADFAATDLCAHEDGVVGGTGTLLWRHVANGQESSASKKRKMTGSEAGRLHPNRLSYCSIHSRLVQMPFGLFLSQAPLCRIAAWWASVT